MRTSGETSPSPSETEVEFIVDAPTEGASNQVHALALVDVSNQARPAKRTKTSRKPASKTNEPNTAPRLRGSRGKLMNILRMPVDIFMEISSHLYPIDLLSLARTSQFLRHMLMSRSSRHMWISAIENVPGLPDCPPDLSEPQYARLVFDNSCFVCGNKRCQRYDSKLRMRCCTACAKTNMVLGTQLGREVPGLTRELLLLLPSIPGRLRRGTNLLRKERWYRPSVVALMTEVSALAPEANSLQELITAKTALTPELTKHEILLKAWHDTDSLKKVFVLQLIRQNRVEQIEEKLIELGYSEEDIEQCKTYKEYKNITDQPHPLTPKIWKNILPKLQTIAEVARGERIEAEEQYERMVIVQRRESIIELYQDYIFCASEEAHGRLPSCVFPIAQLLFSLPDLELLLLDPPDSEPIERLFDIFDTVESTVLQQQLSLRKALYELALNCSCFPNLQAMIADGFLLPPPIPNTAIGFPDLDPSLTADFLSQPTTFFNCNHCKVPLTYPSLTRHTCFGTLDEELDVPRDIGVDHTAVLYARTLESRISARSDVQAYELAFKKFICLRCPSSERKPMCWLELIRHFVSHDESRRSLELCEKCGRDHSFDHALRLPYPLAETTDVARLRSFERASISQVP